MSKRPIYTFRRGNVSAAVWEYVGERGRRLSITFDRVYFGREGTQQTRSFRPDDLLRLRRVIELVEVQLYDLE